MEVERVMYGLEMDDANPEKEALHFELSADNVTPDIGEVRIAIKQAAERLLYHWKTFPIILPSSITDCENEGEDMQMFQHVISFKDLFLAPTFDEVEQVALDAKGKSKRLTDKQLLSIRQTGEFEVESVNFPGQVHRWRITRLLQRGTQRAHDALLNDVAFALSIILIHARNRFCSPFLSVSEGIANLGRAGWQLLDILLGMPSTSTGCLETKLQEEHSRFLVAELHIRPDTKRDWKNFCDYIKDKCSQFDMDKTKTLYMTPPPVPYCFQTPKGNEIDLRLFNRDLMNQCMIILKKILEQESKGWHIKYKDRLITELKGRNMTYAEIKEYVNRSIQEKYIQQVFDTILRSEDFERLQPNLGRLLVDQAKCALSMMKSLAEIRSLLSAHQDEARALIVRTYPVRARIPQWLDERLIEFYNDFISQHRWNAHEQAIEDCRREGLEQIVYFLHRDLIFMRDREAVLKNELSRVREPNRFYEFSSRIWFPQNWIVRRHQYGDDEIIPTVISNVPLGPTSGQSRVPEPDEATFSVEKVTIRRTSSRLPFWRWINYCHRTWVWMWNAMFFLGMVLPWCSPVSLRALVYTRPFMPDLELNRINGTLCPNPSSRTETLVSRLTALWGHVRRSRRNFENEPETGFLGKSCTRHINRAWNYVFKGACGSTVLVIVMVPLCLTVSLMSLLAAVTAAIWMPLVSIFAHIGAFLIYDYDQPVTGVNRLFKLSEALMIRFLLCGILQPICAIIAAIFILPLTSAIILAAAGLRRAIRAAWDAFMFHAVIKKRGRVPSRDGFTVRRIQGPGLASNYFYQVRPEQALAAAEARMEIHELNVWKDNQIRVIEQPKDDYRRFIDKCFGPFSGTLAEIGVFKALSKETKEHVQTLCNTVELRKQKLDTGLGPDIQSRIRLTSRELKVVIAQTAKMLEDFYPEHVLRHLPCREEDFWEDRHLEQGDWQGLATQLLTEVFSSSFLTPLEETDTCFKLQVEHLNLSRYLEMLKSAEFRDDLDVVSTVHTPKGDIDVDAPYLDSQIFSPRKLTPSYVDSSNIRKRRRLCPPWRRSRSPVAASFEMLQVPLMLAHPVVIAVLIHNRDVDGEQISLDSDVCRQIMRATEGLQYVDVQESFDPSHRLDQYDRDTSTPEDHTTTNSDPDVVLVHLAEQERAFSDDSVQHAGGDNNIEPSGMNRSETGGGMAAGGIDLSSVIVIGPQEVGAWLGSGESTTAFNTRHSPLAAGGLVMASSTAGAITPSSDIGASRLSYESCAASASYHVGKTADSHHILDPACLHVASDGGDVGSSGKVMMEPSDVSRSALLEVRVVGGNIECHRIHVDDEDNIAPLAELVAPKAEDDDEEDEDDNESSGVESCMMDSRYSKYSKPGTL